MSNQFKGFSLFNDIEDEKLRTRNRAVVLANMYEDNQKDGKLSPAASGTLLGYFNNIPEAERYQVMEAFKKDMTQRGFKA